MSQAFETILAQCSLAQLVALYNRNAINPIKKFSTKPEALRRTAAMAVQAGLEPVVTEAGVVLQAPVAEEPVAITEVTSEPTVAVKPVKAPKTAGTGKRGPAPRVADTDIITVLVAANPRRPSAVGHARFALYTTGMTVGEYLRQGVALQGESEGRWRGDVYWDIAHEFISVSPKAGA